MILLRRNFIYILFLLPFSANCRTTSAPNNMILDERISVCFEAIYSFNMFRADSLAVSFFSPNSVEFSLVEVNILWWNMISGEDPNRAYIRISDIFNRLIADNLSKSVDTRKLLQIVSIGIIKFRADAVMGSRTNAMRTAMRVLPFYKRILEEENSCAEFYFLVGVYNYMVGVLRSQRTMLIPALIFLPSANTDKGFSILSSKASSGSMMLRYESTYLLYKVDEEILMDSKSAYRRIKDVANEFPHNPIIALEKIKVGSHFNVDIEQSISTFQETVLNSFYLSNQQKAHLLEVSRELKKKYYKK